MANPDHLKILKRGVEVWNRWRSENPNVIPILSRVDLRKADLYLAHLGQADLASANLSDADLRAADLSGARLDGADLSGARLSQAWFIASHFVRVNMSGADVEAAQLGFTVFAATNLSGAHGLNKCIHLAPSIADHRTLELSEDLPMEFLRGCGLPDYIIDAVKVQRGKGIEFYSCFISYSSKNQDFADRLYADLQNKGVRCWLATEDMKIGDEIRNTINQAISVRDKVLLILSEHSIESEWVQDEVESALEEERKSGKFILFPIRIDDTVMDTDEGWARKLRQQRHIGDFTKWKDHDEYQKAFDRLLRDLKAG